ncbi:hypothetical protein AACH10_12940 [Ideonella sp. DXS22W]|uniref:Uncharacterized protein n=1 Tax=Pseudaquabacterium inlustre TaxID=2984192 RepID=A0ABU9CKV9_9BURK
MTPPTRRPPQDPRDLLLQTYLEIEAAERASGRLPSGGTVLTRFRALFEYGCAIVLGLLIASTCVLLVFVVTRVLLHVDFSRYTWL